MSFYYFSFTHTLVVCPFYNKKLKHLEVLIRFLRFPECPFLLHGVAILCLVLVREALFYVYISQKL